MKHSEVITRHEQQRRLVFSFSSRPRPRRALLRFLQSAVPCTMSDNMDLDLPYGMPGGDSFEDITEMFKDAGKGEHRDPHQT